MTRAVAPNVGYELLISIVCFETPEDILRSCLRSLIEAISELHHLGNTEIFCKVVIVNNSEACLPISVDEIFAIRHGASAEFDLEVVQGHGNIGYGSAHNLAISRADSTYLIFMNPDVIIEPNSLDIALRYLNTHPDVVCLSPSSTDLAGCTQYLCKAYPTVFDLFLRAVDVTVLNSIYRHRLALYELREQQDSGSEQVVSIISGCFMICRRKPVILIGGFDSRFFLYFEDFDFSLRIREQGPLVYHPSIKIAHGGGHAARKGMLHIAYFIRSAIRFFNTHGWKWY